MESGFAGSIHSGTQGDIQAFRLCVLILASSDARARQQRLGYVWCVVRGTCARLLRCIGHNEVWLWRPERGEDLPTVRCFSPN